MGGARALLDSTERGNTLHKLDIVCSQFSSISSCWVILKVLRIELESKGKTHFKHIFSIASRQGQREGEIMHKFGVQNGLQFEQLN